MWRPFTRPILVTIKHRLVQQLLVSRPTIQTATINRTIHTSVWHLKRIPIVDVEKAQAVAEKFNAATEKVKQQTQTATEKASVKTKSASESLGEKTKSVGATLGEKVKAAGAKLSAKMKATGEKATESMKATGKKMRGKMEEMTKRQSPIQGTVESHQGITTAAKGTSITGAEDHPPKNVIELIKRDHEAVKLLYREYLDAIDLDTKTKKVYTLIYEMAKHGASEELVLYPFIRDDVRIPGHYRIHERSLAEHTQVKKDLKMIDDVRVGLPEYEQLLSKTVHDFVGHGEMEEHEVLPLLVEHVSAGELLRLGEKFENAATIVTSHPHPLAPAEGLVAVAAHMATKPIDVLRDKMTGREEAIKEEEPKVMKQAEKIVHREATVE